MSKEKSAFMLAREKAKNLESHPSELSDKKVVAFPESLINIEPGEVMGWMKKKAPKPTTDHIVLISDPEVLNIVRDLDVTIFSSKDSNA